MFRTGKVRLVAVLAAVTAFFAAAACSAAAPEPLMLANKALGGGALNQYTPGVTDGIGLNNIGLLVKTCGTVTYVDTTNKFFYIDDGSRVDDKSVVGVTGIRVSYAGLAPGNTFTPPLVNDFVVITGISSTTAVTVGQETRIIPTLRPRRDADKTVL